MPKGKGETKIGPGTMLFDREKLEKAAKDAVIGTVEFTGKNGDGVFYKLAGVDKTISRADAVKLVAGEAAAKRVLFGA